MRALARIRQVVPGAGQDAFDDSRLRLAEFPASKMLNQFCGGCRVRPSEARELLRHRSYIGCPEFIRRPGAKCAERQIQKRRTAYAGKEAVL